MNRILLVFSLIIGLTSCRSTKINETVYKKAPKAQQLIQDVKAAEFDYIWLSAKISGKYQDANQSFSFKGNLKARKDSVIWMSLSPGLGLELGRVLFKKDSVHFMNRFEKTYQKMSYSDLSQSLESPFTFETIEAVLLGNSLGFQNTKYYSTLNEGVFSLSSAQEKQIRKWERSRKKPNFDVYKAVIQPETSKIIEQQVQNYFLSRLLKIRYEDFELHNRQYFAESIALSVFTNQEINLSLSYSKIQLNKPQKFSFKVPASYEIRN